MTNQEFGARVGITHSAASRLRNGQRLPSIELMEKIAAAFPAFPVPAQLKARKAKCYDSELRRLVLERKPAKVAK